MALTIASRILRPVSATLAGICFLVLCPMVILAQVVSAVSIFELAVSYLPHIILLSIFATVGLAFQSKKLAALAGVITLVAAWPFLTFSKFQSPSRDDCAPGACLTVITANVFNQTRSMADLNRLVEREKADLVAINEPAAALAERDYQTLFPNYQRLQADGTPGLGWGGVAPVVLLSRQPVSQTVRMRPENSGRRDLLYADLAEDWASVRVIATHAMVPVSDRGLKQRNTLLDAAKGVATDAENFILMGDFNLTPWSPTFRDLPGRRTGDPRFQRTWPTFFPLMGIPIDHMMISENLELVDSRVLETVGSDHYPILARLRIKR